MSDSYLQMKDWLISNYGGVSRIISNIMNNLNKKTKPNPNSSAQNFAFYACISRLCREWRDCPR